MSDYFHNFVEELKLMQNALSPKNLKKWFTERGRIGRLPTAEEHQRFWDTFKDRPCPKCAGGPIDAEACAGQIDPAQPKCREHKPHFHKWHKDCGYKEFVLVEDAGVQ